MFRRLAIERAPHQHASHQPTFQTEAGTIYRWFENYLPFEVMLLSRRQISGGPSSSLPSWTPSRSDGPPRFLPPVLKVVAEAQACLQALATFKSTSHHRPATHNQLGYRAEPHGSIMRGSSSALALITSANPNRKSHSRLCLVVFHKSPDSANTVGNAPSHSSSPNIPFTDRQHFWLFPQLYFIPCPDGSSAPGIPVAFSPVISERNLGLDSPTLDAELNMAPLAQLDRVYELYLSNMDTLGMAHFARRAAAPGVDPSGLVRQPAERTVLRGGPCRSGGHSPQAQDFDLAPVNV
ncbi:hypothetical protein V8E53_015257 [Lactarius tabidus]